MNRFNQVIGKKVVITGASSDIGAEVAKRGGIPILLARRLNKLEELVVTIAETYNIKAHAFELDISDEQEVVRVFAAIYEQIGEVDVLINNAGFALFKEVDVTTHEEVKSMFEVNVLGLIACTNAVLPAMKAKGIDQIINVASIIGKIPTPKAATYAATKHAVLGFTNALRMETAHTGIQITAVNPGPVKTAFFNQADESGEY